MGTYVQNAVQAKIVTPLGANKLLVRSYSGEEGISSLFRYNLELYSEDALLDSSGIVGQSATLEIQLSNGSYQYVNGVVSRFAQAGRDTRFVTYLAELRPWLWMLTLNAGCRIYQNKTSIDIIKQLFSDLGYSAYADKTTATLAAREFCVQYRETAFGFISRLLEEEGIFYYFTHDASSHTLVLADNSDNWAECAGLSAARCALAGESFSADDAVVQCSFEQNVTVNEYKSDDFNFTIPATQLLASASGSQSLPSIYDYPGLYSTQSSGETIVSRRLAELQTESKVLRGSSLCRAFHVGAKFTLTGHYRSDWNASYVLRSLTVRGDQQEYSNTFEAFPASTNFRPLRITARPTIAGTQTAIVAGKTGEEIWTDEYGRVVVQFHWDQLGKNDEKSSCWVRVAQGWAGNLWGSIFIPRIGQEVVVTFLDGNPDRPLITGCVYNAQQQVPYALPDNQTRSTVKTNSSQGGAGFNELRFEDKAGSEEVFLQAQKDMNVSVLNNESLTVKGTRTIDVTGNETHTNKADYSSTIGGNETRSTKGEHSSTVSGNYKLTVSGNLTIEVSGSISIKSGTSFENTAGTSLTNKSGTDMTNDAGTTLTNKASASQTVDGGGVLTVKGGLVKIN
jgi:type VI secretion system secreted protein VgrG